MGFRDGVGERDQRPVFRRLVDPLIFVRVDREGLPFQDKSGNFDRDTARALDGLRNYN